MARRAESRSKRGRNGESDREESGQDGKNLNGTGVERVGKEAIRIRRRQKEKAAVSAGESPVGAHEAVKEAGLQNLLSVDSLNLSLFLYKTDRPLSRG